MWKWPSLLNIFWPSFSKANNVITAENRWIFPGHMLLRKYFPVFITLPRNPCQIPALTVNTLPLREYTRWTVILSTVYSVTFSGYWKQEAAQFCSAQTMHYNSSSLRLVKTAANIKYLLSFLSYTPVSLYFCFGQLLSAFPSSVLMKETLNVPLIEMIVRSSTRIDSLDTDFNVILRRRFYILANHFM